MNAHATLPWLPPLPRNMRLFSLLALIGTTYTSWYMMAESWKHGLNAAAATQPPLGLDAFFQGFSNIVFTFGGHCMIM